MKGYDPDQRREARMNARNDLKRIVIAQGGSGIDLKTGELLRDEDFDMYRPQGDCATGCGHPATALWELYRGAARYEFRCKCCCVFGTLEKAKYWAKRIEKLEAEYATARESCGTAK
jgi:hypothetical protein